jgi:hypothetical protein
MQQCMMCPISISGGDRQGDEQPRFGRGVLRQARSSFEKSVQLLRANLCALVHNANNIFAAAMGPAIYMRKRRGAGGAPMCLPSIT